MGETLSGLKPAIGKKIVALSLTDEALHIEVDDGTKIRIHDDGQDCCESRYMRTDDELPYYVGAELVGAEVRDAPELVTTCEVHEVQFLVLHTSKGDLTMSSHNEHNGYYGGFNVKAVVE